MAKKMKLALMQEAIDASHTDSEREPELKLVNTSRTRRNGSTCVYLVEDCKKATCIHVLCRCCNKVKSKQKKHNS